MSKHTTYAHMTDEQLVELAKGTDAQAMDELYHRYKNIVRGKARPYFLMGSDREDLMQEGMIGFFKAVRDYDSAKCTAFRPFADLCVVRQILTAIRGATRDKHMPLNRYESLYKPAYGESDDPLIDVLNADAALDPEELFLRREYSTSVEKVINEQLTPFEHDVLEFYLAGMTYSEISERVGRGTKAVDNALQRIRKKLEKSLAILS